MVSMFRKKVLFLGKTSFDNTPCAGEVVKNQLLYGRLKNVLGKQMDILDTKSYSRRLYFPLMCLRIFLKQLLYQYDIIIVSTYDLSALRIINFLGALNKANKVCYWVIGGGVSKRIENGELKSKYYKELWKIIVEDIDIENHFRAMGFKNVSTIPNFKPVFSVSSKKKEIFNKFIFVSRITPLKGCDMILSAVRQLNRKNISINVDFYGFIEKGYPFEEYIKDLPNVKYKGVLSLKSKLDYEYLNQYTALLFPTYYPNEGFPGTMIDGFIAGLPIISTYWRYNSHILEDNITGWLIPPQDADALAEVMESIAMEHYDINAMAENCLKKANDYDINNLLSEDFLVSLGII